MQSDCKRSTEYNSHGEHDGESQDQSSSTESSVLCSRLERMLSNISRTVLPAGMGDVAQKLLLSGHGTHG
jgi:hypothetical protein